MSKEIIVKLTGDERELVGAINRGDKAQEKLNRSVDLFGIQAKSAASSAKMAVDATSLGFAALEKAVGKAGKNLSGLPKEVRDQFKLLAKDTGITRSGFERIDDAVEHLRETTSMTDAQLERMRQTLKRTATDAELAKAAKQNKRNVDSIVRSIGLISPEMKRVADAAALDLSAMGESGEQSVEKMLSQMRRLSPEGKRQADAIESRMKKALDAVEREFKGPLDQLRKLGPAGDKAAGRIKREMVVAGTISEAALSRIMNPLVGLGGNAAAVAGKVAGHFKGAAEKSTKSWAAFATKMTGALGGTLAFAQTVRFAIDELNKSLERQAALRIAAKNANRDLASIQAEALPSLAGLPEKVQQDLIDTSPRRIAGDTGTGMIGAKELAESAGVIVSSGVSRPEVVAEVMKVSAELNQLSPASISEFAKATAGALKASGQQDQPESVRTTASAIIAGMKGSGVTSLGQFAQAAPRALAAGALASDGDKFAQAVGAFDALAIAGAASQKTGDDKGERSSTFAAQMAGKLDQFFESKLIEQTLLPSVIQVKREELTEAKQRQRELAESDKTGRATEQRTELASEIKKLEQELSGLVRVSRINFGQARTPLARLQTIQRFDLQDDFREVSGQFGDATFKGVIDDLLAGGEVFRDTLRTRRDILGQQVGPEAGSYAAELIRQQEGVQPTVPMNVARASNEGVSAGELATLDATGKAAAQASLDIVKQAVTATEDTATESANLLRQGYRPGPIKRMLGFEGSIERDGFGGNSLQQIVRAQSFLQDQEARYFERRVPVASGAATMGVTAYRTAERDPAELSSDELREAGVYSRAIEANQRLLGKLEPYDTRQIKIAANEAFGIAREQFAAARSDGRISERERRQLDQTGEAIRRLNAELERRSALDAASSSRVEAFLERIADASEVSADNTTPGAPASPAGQQEAVNGSR